MSSLLLLLGHVGCSAVCCGFLCRQNCWVDKELFVLFGCRLFFVGSREGHMPEVLCFVQVNRLTPAPAVMFVVCLINLSQTYNDQGRIQNF